MLWEQADRRESTAPHIEIYLTLRNLQFLEVSFRKIGSDRSLASADPNTDGTRAAGGFPEAQYDIAREVTVRWFQAGGNGSRGIERGEGRHDGFSWQASSGDQQRRRHGATPRESLRSIVASCVRPQGIAKAEVSDSVLILHDLAVILVIPKGLKTVSATNW